MTLNHCTSDDNPAEPAGITITDQAMRSPATPHYALPADPSDPYAEWSVSWLPGRTLSRNQAITAMVIATLARDLVPGDRRWPFIDGWAAELGLSGPDAVARASESPDVPQ